MERDTAQNSLYNVKLAMTRQTTHFSHLYQKEHLIRRLVHLGPRKPDIGMPTQLAVDLRAGLFMAQAEVEMYHHNVPLSRLL